MILDPDIIHNARDFAIARHGEQKYGIHSYVVHLRHVVRTLARFGFDGRYPSLCAAGWCHDVVEDTSTTIEEVRARFGDEVARLVWAVTNEPGRNRKERAAATYPKILAAGRSAVVLKLCDRIANVEACVRTQDHKLSMYRKEYPGFRAALRREEDGADVLDMWKHLDSLLGWEGQLSV